MLIPALLTGLVVGLCKMDYFFGYCMLNRPIVEGALVGLVLGDVATGAIIGASLEIVFLGSFPIGAAVSPDGGTAAGVSTALAVLTGAGTGIGTTFAVPLAMARAFPESVRRAHADGHEIAAGSFAKEDVAGLSPDEERERIERTFSGLAELTGTRPEGWFTLPRTGTIIRAVRFPKPQGNCCSKPVAGISATPWRTTSRTTGLRITTGGTRCSCCPIITRWIRSSSCFSRSGQGERLVQTRALWENWAAELEGVRAWGRQSTFVIQPYLMQFGAARALLDRLMRAVTGAPDLWIATSGACAAYWKQAYPRIGRCVSRRPRGLMRNELHG